MMFPAAKHANPANICIISANITAIAFTPVHTLIVCWFQFPVSSKNGSFWSEKNLCVIKSENAISVIQLVDTHHAVYAGITARLAKTVRIITRDDNGIFLQSHIPHLPLITFAVVGTAVIRTENRNIAFRKSYKFSAVCSSFLDLCDGNIDGFLFVKYNLRSLNSSNSYFFFSTHYLFIRFR